MHVVPATGEYIPLGVKYLRRKEPVVIPTDTLYGICADALDYRAVERVFELKHRSPNKPLIVLVPDPAWVKTFFFIKEMPPSAEKLFKSAHPISVILPAEGFDWISRGSGKIAFRVVKGGFVKEFLEHYGRPIVAPSANWEGFPPAADAAHALFYFGNRVPVYYNAGALKGQPSALVDLTTPTPQILRKGPLSESELQKLLKN